MSNKAKSAVLFGVGIAVFLGLYRNFGVPVLRFWPLILIDTLTRFPGDNLHGVLHLRIPEATYKLLRGLLQIPMAILWRWGATQSIRVLRSKKREASTPATQINLPPAESWISPVHPALWPTTQ